MSDDTLRELLELAQDVRALATLDAQSGALLVRQEERPLPANSPEPTGPETPSEVYENASGRVTFSGGGQRTLVIVMSVATGPEPMHPDVYEGPSGEMLEKMRHHVLCLSREDISVVRIKYATPRPAHPDVLACGEAIRERIEGVQPKAVLCFGVGSARTLLGDTPASRNALGKWLRVGGRPMLTTHHPDDLLQTPADKRMAFEHLKRMHEELSGS